jgi:hypothetical protein
MLTRSRTGALTQRAHELSRRLFRRWLWSLGVGAGGFRDGLPGRFGPAVYGPAGISGNSVESGLVASLVRPGGNITGGGAINVELMAKRLELLCELVPQAKAIAPLVNPNIPIADAEIKNVQEAARAKGVQLPILKASQEPQSMA